MFQQQRRQEGGRQHAQLPAHADVSRSAVALLRRPGFGDQRHADAEFAAQPDARQGAIGQQIPIPLRHGAQAGEQGEHQNGDRQHPDTAETIAEVAENHAAQHRAD